MFRGSNGYITCSLLGCKNPAAAHDLLSGKPPLIWPEPELLKPNADFKQVKDWIK